MTSQIAPKDRPILFKDEMVRAILNGRKTQTRRVVNPQPSIDMMGNFCWNGSNFGQDFNGPHVQAIASPIPSSKTKRVRCPYGKPGDRLWVRESHAQVFEVDIPSGRPVGPIGTAGSPGRPDWKCRYVYRADGEMPSVQWHHVGDSQPVRWTPSIHMPRMASRITLEITGVRVERLQTCNEADAIAEGAPWAACGAPQEGSHKAGFAQLWESINGPGSWDLNPWVWVIEFKRVAA